MNIKHCSVLAALVLMAAKSNAQEQDSTTFIPDKELSTVTITARTEIRKMREATMPLSVLDTRQLEGTTSSINDALARTSGITIRNTGGVGSASRISES